MLHLYISCSEVLPLFSPAPHQANIRIMDAVASRLNIPSKKILSNLGKYGNTSAGSIPLALDEAVKEGKVKTDDIVACAGFGAGLSWGALILRWGGCR